MSFRKLFLAGTLILVTGVVLGLQLGATLLGDDFSQAVRKVQDAFVLVSQRYVEEIDPDELAGEAIQGMVDALDPHSAYIDARRMQQENERFAGSFEGIGIAYDLIEGSEGSDTLSVVEVLPGGPSESAGLLSGDRILAVDDSTAIGITDLEVQARIKGPRGSVVTLDVRRPGYGGLLRFEIERDRVPIVTVDAAFMLDRRTGYLKLNRFARTTHREFRAALQGLMARGMEKLVFDLRGNSGGLMNMAVAISDEFLAGGQPIVSQRGRTKESNAVFASTDGGLWEDRPLIILVDGGSASASEIVAGAVQDHDRGLIVGRRSFGKGLVQNQLILADGSALRLTVARFYTPSGRLIQTEYDDGGREAYYEEKMHRLREDRTIGASEVAEEVPDSLKYQTDAGRTVIAGGGIVPDFIVRNDTLAAYVRALLARGLEGEFVREWLDREGETLRERYGSAPGPFIEGFSLGEDDLASLREFAKGRGVHVVQTLPEERPEGTAWFTEDAFSEAKEELRYLIKGRLARRLFDRSAWYPAYAPADATLQEALQLWPQSEELAGLHAVVR